MMRFLIALFMLFPIKIWAAGKSVAPPDLALTSLLGSLLLVLGCIFLFAFLVKKTNLLKNVGGKSQIKVIATQPLTNKGRVQMIEINDQQYLLGVTEHNITLLDKLDKPLIVEEKSNKQPTMPFSALLSKISKKNDE